MARFGCIWQEVLQILWSLLEWLQWIAHNTTQHITHCETQLMHLVFSEIWLHSYILYKAAQLEDNVPLNLVHVLAVLFARAKTRLFFFFANFSNFQDSQNLLSFTRTRQHCRHWVFQISHYMTSQTTGTCGSGCTSASIYICLLEKSVFFFVQHISTSGCIGKCLCGQIDKAGFFYCLCLVHLHVFSQVAVCWFAAGLTVVEFC